MASLFLYYYPRNDFLLSTLETQGGPEVENTYHGKPCKRCGGTLRDSRSRACLICKNNRHKEKINISEKIEGSPCKKCGGTLRYVRDRACVACTREKNRIKTEQRRARNAQIPKRERGDQRCQSCGETKNYFFLDYCRECVTAEKTRVPEQHKPFTRCDNCGEWKPYSFKGHCKACEAAEQRRRIHWEAEDKLRELEALQRRYADPF